MKALIIGGGIAGLTTAIALRQRGFDCQVYEAAAAIKPVGAGIMMASNAMSVFDKLNVAEKVIQVSCPIKKANITDEKLTPIQTTDFRYVEEKFGYGVYAMYRARLQQVLLEELPSDAVSTGKRFVKLNQQEDKVVAYFEDESTAEGDILIGADGLHSRVRPFVCNTTLRYGGQTTWRGVASSKLSNQFKSAAYEAWGGKARFGFVEIAQDEVYWYAALTAAAGEKEEVVGRKQRLLSSFSSFADPIPQIIAESEENNIIRTDIFDIKPFQKWFEKRVCLIGDAAHPTTPNMGQGGAQAVEDALSLADALANAQEVEDAFRLFCNKRIKKASIVTQNSYLFGKVAHLERGRKIRDFVFRRIPPKVSTKQLEKILAV